MVALLLFVTPLSDRDISRLSNDDLESILFNAAIQHSREKLWARHLGHVDRSVLDKLEPGSADAILNSGADVVLSQRVHRIIPSSSYESPYDRAVYLVGLNGNLRLVPQHEDIIPALRSLENGESEQQTPLHKEFKDLVRGYESQYAI